jgi:monoamine oxidase
MNKENIIIVGAGIAGLIAARALAADHNVLVIEASERAGGRILTYRGSEFPCPVEGGAEFVHGKLKHTLRLLKEAGIEYVPVKGKMYSKEKNKWKEQHDMIEGWDLLLRKMKKLKEDMTMQDFLLQYFDGNKYAALRRHVTNYTEGFDVADIRKVSVRSLYEEWSNEDEENFRLPKGYGALIDFLVQQCEQKGCSFMYNAAVKQIDREKNAATVYTADEKKYSCNKVIIATPLSSLQRSAAACSINFTPPLDKAVHAAKQIGLGTVVKIVLLFKEHFWKADAGFIFSDEIFPTWWTQLPNKAPLLTGWAGGPKAELLHDEMDEPVLQKALSSLSNIFDMTVEELSSRLQSYKVFNWSKNEWALGAYSYATPESKAAKKLLSKPVDNTIFFCGEGIYDGNSPGTVEGAIVSAKKMIKKLR